LQSNKICEQEDSFLCRDNDIAFETGDKDGMEYEVTEFYIVNVRFLELTRSRKPARNRRHD
jgi:hypothetical protein